MPKNDLLRSHTADSSAQDLVALMVAIALLTRERTRGAGAQLTMLVVSCVNTVELLRRLRLAF